MNLNCLRFKRCKRVSHSPASKKIEQSSIIPYLIRKLSKSALHNHAAAHSPPKPHHLPQPHISNKKTSCPGLSKHNKHAISLYLNNDKPKREHTPELTPKQKYQHGTCEKPGALFLSGGKSVNGRQTDQK
jgi:hypothetical protein